MMSERQHAKLLANGYFALVNQWSRAFEKYLDRNVCLHWFGKTKRGRREVSNFFQEQEVILDHEFKVIGPSDTYERKRKRQKPKNSSCKKNTETTSDAGKAETYEEGNQTKSETPIDSTAFGIHQDQEESRATRNNDAKESEVHRDQEASDSMRGSMTEEDNDRTSYDFQQSDLPDLFKLQIEPTFIKEIKEDINRTKLEEEMARSTSGAIKMESEQRDMPGDVKTKMKYMTAYGTVNCVSQFFKKGKTEVTVRTGIYRRRCELQIAYSEISYRDSSLDSSLEEATNAPQPARISPPPAIVDQPTDSQSSVQITPRTDQKADPQKLSKSPIAYIYNYKIHKIIYNNLKKRDNNLVEKIDDSSDHENTIVIDF